MDDLIDLRFQENQNMKKTSSIVRDIESGKEEGQPLNLTYGFEEFVPHKLFHFDNEVLKDLVQTVQLSSDFGVSCLHCGDGFKALRFICISCEGSPSICERCLDEKHHKWHVTIRKPVFDAKEFEDDANSDHTSFVPYDEEGNQEADLIGSFATCGSLEKFEAVDYDGKSEEATDDSLSLASSEWDTMSLEYLPDCFNFDRSPDPNKSSLLKVPSLKNGNMQPLKFKMPEDQDDLESCDEGLPWADPPEEMTNSYLDFQVVQSERDFASHEPECEVASCSESESSTHESILNQCTESINVSACDRSVGSVIEGSIPDRDTEVEVAEFQPALDGSTLDYGFAYQLYIDPQSIDMPQETQNHIPRRRIAQSFRKSFEEVGDPFSDDDVPDMVDFIAQAAHQVSGAAMRTVDTIKRVFRVFQHGHLQSSSHTTCYDWIPPAMRWTGDLSVHPTDADGIMRALIEMGFADRHLNGLLIKQFDCSFEKIVDHITNREYSYTGWA